MDSTYHAAVTDTNEHLTIVIKLGTSSIVNETSLQPQLALLSALTECICALRKLGHRVVLVSSGAIGMGLKRMDMAKKPKLLPEKQALAAIGQGRLIALWDNLFSLLGQPIAQVLLTRNDISDRSRYLNSTKTLSALLNYGVVPIVNENDTVSVSEIKFGDNDTLSAITAAMIQADYLFLFTDVDCLYTANPRRHPDTAKPVQIVRDIEAVRASVSTATLGSSLGTGGMETKLIAAELATGAGVATVITHGAKPSSILDIVSQPPGISDEQYLMRTPLHTVFIPKDTPLSDRRWWVLHGLKPRGRIVIDEGAYRATARSPSSTKSAAPAPPTPTSTDGPVPRRSSNRNTFSGNGGRLLPAGVLAVEGDFAGGQAVTIVVRKRRRRREPSDHCHTSQRAGTTQGFSAAGLASRLLAEANGPEHIIAGTPEQSPPATPSLSQSQELSRRDTTDNTLAGSTDSLHSLHISSNDLSPETRAPGPSEHTNGTEWEEIEVGQGLANYNSLEIDRIKGHKSSEIERILGYIEAEHCVESITSLKRVIDP